MSFDPDLLAGVFEISSIIIMKSFTLAFKFRILIPT